MYGIFLVFMIIFAVMFAMVLTIVAVSFFGVLKKKRANDKAPLLTVNASVTNLHEEIRSHGSMRHAYTSYFATFEVESGDRIVLDLYRTDFAMLKEGDRGKLTFQGSRFISFERIDFKDLA